jgi:CheY-like chemotaxis protein
MKAPGCGTHALLDVLLVDDDRNDLALFGMAADKADVNIWLQTAGGAEQAIEYLEGKGGYQDRTMHPFPDLLLLDLVMPGMDGFAFLAWRKGAPAFAKLPVIVLSGLGDKGRIEQALALGADGYLAKPADFDGWADLARHVWDLGIKHSREARSTPKLPQS